MTRLEAIEEEIRKLSPDELAELRDWLGEPELPLESDAGAPKSGKYTFEDIRREIFPTPPRPHTPEELTDGLHGAICEKHGRR